MRRWKESKFLCMLLTLGALPVFAEVRAEQSKHANRSLYYDKEQSIYYDPQETCKFIGEYLEIDTSALNIRHISASERSDIQNGKFSGVEPNILVDPDMKISIYQYSGDGVQIRYSSEKVLKIWSIKYAASRLPANMQHIDYYIKRLGIQPYQNNRFLTLDCVGADVKIIFKEKNLESIKFNMSLKD